MSRNNQATDPAFALTLNPFNTDATVNLVVDALNGAEEPDRDALSRSARAMVSASRADARGYSMLGAIEDRAGNGDTAQALYALALQRSKTELHALMRTAVARLQQEDMAGALEYIDLLLRRWPDYWASVQPIMQRLATDPDTAPLLRTQLDRLPPWRGRAIAGLARAGALDFLDQLVSAAPAEIRARPGWTGERDAVIGALLAGKAYARADALFRSNLTAAEAGVAGPIFDGGFTLASGGGHFGWRVQQQGAPEISYGGRSAGAMGLRVRFLDSPARPGIVSQRLLLPPGRYRLSVALSAANLRVPKELFWSIRCEAGSPLTILSVPSGSLETQLQAEFEVPASGCGLQTISLDTAVRTESWRDRYQGEVRFSSLAITPL